MFNVDLLPVFLIIPISIIVLWKVRKAKKNAAPIKLKAVEHVVRVIYPEYAGKVLKLPESQSVRKELQYKLKEYISDQRLIEEGMGLNPGQTPISDMFSETHDLQDIKFRIIILNWMIRKGEVNTGWLYKINTETGQPFDAELFKVSAYWVERDLAVASIPLPGE